MLSSLARNTSDAAAVAPPASNAALSDAAAISHIERKMAALENSLGQRHQLSDGEMGRSAAHHQGMAVMGSASSESLSNAASALPALRLDCVEFELRHVKEHLAKLKFNYLELETKRCFLERLMDGREWNEVLTAWSPGDIKSLEKRVEMTKSELKTAKQRVADLKGHIQNLAEHLTLVRGVVQRKFSQSSELLAEIKELHAQVDELNASMPALVELSHHRSLEELQSILDDQSIAIEKRSSAVDAQQTVNSELGRLLQHHRGELERLQGTHGELTAQAEQVEATRKASSEKHAALERLCRWYKSSLEIILDITRMRFEMIRPDYLLVTCYNVASSNTATISSIPVHITVEPRSGRLVAAQIGTTSNTPRHQWKDVIDVAVANNDIPFLLRQVQQRLGFK